MKIEHIRKRIIEMKKQIIKQSIKEMWKGMNAKQKEKLRKEAEVEIDKAFNIYHNAWGKYEKRLKEIEEMEWVSYIAQSLAGA